MGFEIIISENDQDSLNKYELLQSKSSDVVDIYKKIFEQVEGSVTTVSDNDSGTRINIAISNLNPNEIQVKCLRFFQKAFKYVESCIDPARLNFTVTLAEDDEICINRISDIGVSKIIIHEDGLIAHSFISFKLSDKKDILDFYDDCETIDYESLTFKLFSY